MPRRVRTAATSIVSTGTTCVFTPSVSRVSGPHAVGYYHFQPDPGQGRHAAAIVVRADEVEPADDGQPVALVAPRHGAVYVTPTGRALVWATLGGPFDAACAHFGYRDRMALTNQVDGHQPVSARFVARLHQLATSPPPPSLPVAQAGLS